MAMSGTARPDVFARDDAVLVPRPREDLAVAAAGAAEERPGCAHDLPCLRGSTARCPSRSPEARLFLSIAIDEPPTEVTQGSPVG